MTTLLQGCAMTNSSQTRSFLKLYASERQKAESVNDKASIIEAVSTRKNQPIHSTTGNSIDVVNAGQVSEVPELFQLKNLASIAEDAKTLKQMQMFLQTWTEETCDSIPTTLSHDQFDRETGKPLRPDSKSKDWFRGTPAGWDQKADHTLEHGPT